MSKRKPLWRWCIRCNTPQKVTANGTFRAHRDKRSNKRCQMSRKKPLERRP